LRSSSFSSPYEVTSASHSVLDSHTRHYRGFWKHFDPHRQHRIPQERLQMHPTSLARSSPLFMTHGNLGGSHWFDLFQETMNSELHFPVGIEESSRIRLGKFAFKMSVSRRCAEMFMSTSFATHFCGIVRGLVGCSPMTGGLTCLNRITLRAQLRTVAYVGIVSEILTSSEF